jgi:hypothetical protein
MAPLPFEEVTIAAAPAKIPAGDNARNAVQAPQRAPHLILAAAAFRIYPADGRQPQ